MKTWEYTEGYDLGVEELDEYGEEGWELAAVYVTDDNARFVFKRPLASAEVADNGSGMTYPPQYG